MHRETKEERAYWRTRRLSFWYRRIKELSDARTSASALTQWVQRQVERDPRLGLMDWDQCMQRVEAGHHPTRRQLFDVFEASPLYRGAKQLYVSPIWDLLDRGSLTQIEVSDLTVTALANNGLKRLEFAGNLKLQAEVYAQSLYSFPGVYADYLDVALENIDGWQAITLTALLSVEAAGAYKSEVATMALRKLDHLLQETFDGIALCPNLDDYHDMIEIIAHPFFKYALNQSDASTLEYRVLGVIVSV